MAERRAVTEAAATRYKLAGKRGKSRILDELCANTGWHRNHARKALAAALQPRIVTARSARPVKYGSEVIAALTVCWRVLGMPAGKRLAPMLGELVAVLRQFGELSIDEGTAELLVSMSAATHPPAASTNAASESAASSAISGSPPSNILFEVTETLRR